MEKYYDDYYAALGLAPGANDSEIRAAYRRMVKLYHPDKDASLDAQMRYQEIRTAYDVLRNRPNPETTGIRQPTQEAQEQATHRSYTYDDFQEVYRDFGMSGNFGWQSASNATETDLFGFTVKIPPDSPSVERRPFSFEHLPHIVATSLEETLSILLLLRIVIFGYLLWWGMAPISKTLAAIAIPLTLIGGAVFRYYYTRPPQKPEVYFLGSFIYGAGMGFFMTLVSALTASMGGGILEFLVKFLFNTLLYYAALFPLWAHPIVWLAVNNGARRRWI